MDKLTPKQKSAMRLAFLYCDKDASGDITIDELGFLFRALGGNPTDAELEEYITNVDKNKNGKVDMDEFFNLAAKYIKALNEDEADIAAAFMKFDICEKGYITADDLKNYMMQLGGKLGEEEAAELIREADLNGDGKIDYREFAKKMAELV